MPHSAGSRKLFYHKLTIEILEMKEIRYKPIGVIHTPFKEPINVPIQPSAGRGIKGKGCPITH